MPLRSNAPLRPTDHRTTRIPRIALRAGLALALTAPVVVTGVAASSVDSAEDAAQGALAAATSTTDGAEALVQMSDLSDRAERASRSAVRTMKPVTLKPRATDKLWTTAPLNVWTGPGEDTERVGLVKWGTPLAVTGQRVDGWAEVLLGKGRKDRWVNAKYLAEKKPKPKPTASSGSSGASGSSGSSTDGLSTAPCPDGSSIEAGLTSNADVVYRAVCNAFPSLTTYGGLDPHGEHYDGRAIDFMVTGSTGDAIAEYLRANAATFNVRNIIWSQRIWSSERASEGWRYMSDRGSTTANHYDHVHISVH
jgi:hypothetical protein